jgi:hypothetical protein
LACGTTPSFRLSLSSTAASNKRVNLTRRR